MKRSPGGPVRIRAFYPNYFSDTAIAMAALRIVMYFNGGESAADLMGFSSDATMHIYKRPLRFEDVPANDDRVLPPIYRDAFRPGPEWALTRRLFSVDRINVMAERRYLSSLEKGDIAYLWPGASVDLYRKAKMRGCTIISERVNTLLGTSMVLLDAEFRRLGLPPSHGITDEQVEEELECMGLSDLIFSPSPAVTGSIIAAGLPKERILQTSYGLKKTEILKRTLPQSGGRRCTALFAGRICVRKGVHLLLEAWKKAATDARLIVVGRIAPETEALFTAALRDTPNVEYREHVTDLAPLYRDADFFVLPSIEEGSPLVTYLALGAGLPSIVSSMGAGGAVEDGEEGVVIDPHDAQAFASAIQHMVRDGAVRAKMASAAEKKASEYTWDIVGRRRLHALLAKVGRP